ncbi:MAG: glycine cleavage system protein GcvH [Candidatus Omnitrophota bacterium]|jgi:glycine cleavage system H protein
MNFPKELKYTKTHEWASKKGNLVTVGITQYAQGEISDVVFVELPKAAQVLVQGKPAAVVESVKAAFDIYSPMSGKVTRMNTQLESKPELVNQDCYAQGWLFELELSNPAEWDALMASDAYEAQIQQEHH